MRMTGYRRHQQGVITLSDDYLFCHVLQDFIALCHGNGTVRRSSLCFIFNDIAQIIQQINPEEQFLSRTVHSNLRRPIRWSILYSTIGF